MRNFAVVVSGSNLYLRVEGAVQILGFEVTRFVRASDPLVAARQAEREVAMSRQIAAAENAASDPPVWHATETRELPHGESVPLRQPGFAFHKEARGG